VEHEGELYGERHRLKNQNEALATGQVQPTDRLERDVRVKLNLAWEDVTGHVAFRNGVYELESYIARRTLGSIAASVQPSDMPPGKGQKATNTQLLSLIEAEHEALAWLAANPHFANPGYPGASPQWFEVITTAPERFRSVVNRVLGRHAVSLSLHENSLLLPVQSQEMHHGAVEPALHLLHNQAQFAAAENAYQDALRELRDGYPDDAITDAATALQDVLKALGCTGNALGDMLKSARKNGLITGKDTPLTETVGRTVDWVATQRNHGEAHHGDPDIDMSDAWMVVHVVGALIIRLSEKGNVPPGNSSAAQGTPPA
jgi:hypothetical protein